MALRTYRFLRLGVVLVIALLAVSILKETFKANPDCLQGSISAYYYTPVQSVFVGALTVLGFTMIVLWGKTWVEDACFNLAGLLAPVVAFVPTSDTNKCRLIDTTGELVKTEAEKQQVIDASHAAINNNMSAYLLAVLIALVALLAVGVVAHSRQAGLVESPYTFWGPFVAATLLWTFGMYRFNQDGRAWLYEHAHMAAAITMFIFIVVAIFAVSYAKWRPNTKIEEKSGRFRGWAMTYFALASTMSLGAAAIYWWPHAWGSTEFFDHLVFWLEAWMILGVAVFWLLQTVDRWDDGAPPRTEAERAVVEARMAFTAD